jgi:hypothetical protein
MVGDEGVPDMYSRINLLTNEIARLRSKEITYHFIGRRYSMISSPNITSLVAYLKWRQIIETSSLSKFVLMKWGFRTKKSLEACLLLGKSETLL